jgi:hypothetical protein
MSKSAVYLFSRDPQPADDTGSYGLSVTFASPPVLNQPVPLTPSLPTIG